MDNNRTLISAIGVAAQEEPIYLQIGEATIELRRKIPYKEVIDMLQWAVDLSVTEAPYVSPILHKMIEDFAIINFYTSLDAGKDTPFGTPEEVYAAYDIVKDFKVMEEILPKLDAAQVSFFKDCLRDTLAAIDTYRQSAKGIVDQLVADADKDVNSMQSAVELLSDDEKNEKISRLLRFAEQVHPTE